MLNEIENILKNKTKEEDMKKFRKVIGINIEQIFKELIDDKTLIKIIKD